MSDFLNQFIPHKNECSKETQFVTNPEITYWLLTWQRSHLSPRNPALH